MDAYAWSRLQNVRVVGVRIKDGCVCVVEAPEWESRGMRDESCVTVCEHCV